MGIKSVGQQSFQNNLKECNKCRNKYKFLWDFYIVRLDSLSFVYTKMDDLSDG